MAGTGGGYAGPIAAMVTMSLLLNLPHMALFLVKKQTMYEATNLYIHVPESLVVLRPASHKVSVLTRMENARLSPSIKYIRNSVVQ